MRLSLATSHLISLLCMATLVGCDIDTGDVWGNKREAALNLFRRIENGDAGAFDALHRLASQQDDVHGSMQFALALQTGAGNFMRNDDLALKLYTKASGRVPEADFNAGLIYLSRGNIGEAVQSFERAAGKDRKGLTNAMVQLGRIYEAGLAGAPRSASLAAEWYEYAADAGDLHARCRLGWLLLTGKGRPQDVHRGVDLLEQAALLGSREAGLLLSSIFAQPPVRAMQRSRESAAKWFLVSARGVARLEAQAEAYVNGLTALEQQVVREAVGVYVASHPAPRDPIDYARPLNVM